MAVNPNLPPPPTGQPVDSWQWRDWFYRLLATVSGGGSGGFGGGTAGQVPISAGPGLPAVWTTVRLTQSFVNVDSITVIHNFGVVPIVQVLDSTNSMIIPMQVQHLSVNAFVVNFSILVTGTIITTML